MADAFDKHNNPKKTYLGDGVYAHHDGYHVVLTTENGIETTNTIALEPEVLHALAVYTASLTNDTGK